MNEFIEDYADYRNRLSELYGYAENLWAIIEADEMEVGNEEEFEYIDPADFGKCFGYTPISYLEFDYFTWVGKNENSYYIAYREAAFEYSIEMEGVESVDDVFNYLCTLMAEVFETEVNDDDIRQDIADAILSGDESQLYFTAENREYGNRYDAWVACLYDEDNIHLVCQKADVEDIQLKEIGWNRYQIVVEK